MHCQENTAFENINEYQPINLRDGFFPPQSASLEQVIIFSDERSCFIQNMLLPFKYCRTDSAEAHIVVVGLCMNLDKYSTT